MVRALNAGYLDKIEFDYQEGAVFFSIKNKGRVCGVEIDEFKKMVF